MKAINHKIPLMVLFAVAIFISSCQSDNTKKQTVTSFGEKNKDSYQNMSDGFSETFYRIPSPEDLFDLVSTGNIEYNADVLNSADNITKYIDTKSKELNFGIYSADLAYTSAFQKYQASYDYIEIVRKLSSDIGIAAVFDEAMLARVHNIFENSDSLMNVTNNTYGRFVRHLEQNNRSRTLALISAGGWIESLYIVVNLVGDYKEGDTNVQRIADQKLTFENLLDYLIQHKDDKSISSVLSDMAPIKLAYEALTETKSSSELKSTEDQIVVGGGRKIVITEAQYIELKKAIISVRTKLTLNQ